VDAHRTWRWINLQGAVLSEGVLLPNQSMDWSVEGYASGLYLLELNQGATVERHRVVVGH
jgi:hypothetical protein